MRTNTCLTPVANNPAASLLPLLQSSAKPGTMMRVEVQVAEPLDAQLQFATVSEAKIKQSRLTVFPPHAAKLEGGTT